FNAKQGAYAAHNAGVSGKIIIEVEAIDDNPGNQLWSGIFSRPLKCIPEDNSRQGVGYQQFARQANDKQTKATRQELVTNLAWLRQLRQERSGTLDRSRKQPGEVRQVESKIDKVGGSS